MVSLLLLLLFNLKFAVLQDYQIPIDTTIYLYRNIFLKSCNTRKTSVPFVVMNGLVKKKIRDCL